VRLKRIDDAIAALKAATALEPDYARYGYVYAVALHSKGQIAESVRVLKQSAEKSPNDRDILIALVGFLREDGEIATALKYTEQLAAAYPADKAIADLIATLRQQIGTAQ
jgi:tetratricopeptide (TPR) repeat protein